MLQLQQETMKTATGTSYWIRRRKWRRERKRGGPRVVRLIFDPSVCPSVLLHLLSDFFRRIFVKEKYLTWDWWSQLFLTQLLTSWNILDRNTNFASMKTIHNFCKIRGLQDPNKNTHDFWFLTPNLIFDLLRHSTLAGSPLRSTTPSERADQDIETTGGHSPHYTTQTVSLIKPKFVKLFENLQLDVFAHSFSTSVGSLGLIFWSWQIKRMIFDLWSLSGRSELSDRMYVQQEQDLVCEQGPGCEFIPPGQRISALFTKYDWSEQTLLCSRSLIITLTLADKTRFSKVFSLYLMLSSIILGLAS